MVHQWIFSLTALLLAVPLSLGCGSSGSSNKGTGLSAAELEKMMEADKEEAAKAAAAQVTAKELVESLAADPSKAESARSALAGKKRLVKGTVIERSAEESDSPFLILDGGTQKDQAYKVKFIFAKDQASEIASAKVGDTVQISGTTAGYLEDATLEFNGCTLDQPGMAPPSGSPSLPPVSNSK